MKIVSRKISPMVAVIAVLAGTGSISLAQPMLSVNPSVISNTYTGDITLNITGLTNTEQVQVLSLIHI